MLIINDALPVVVDVQGKLASLIDESERVIKNIKKAICGLRLLGVKLEEWIELESR